MSANIPHRPPMVPSKVNPASAATVAKKTAPPTTVPQKRRLTAPPDDGGVDPADEFHEGDPSLGAAGNDAGMDPMDGTAGGDAGADADVSAVEQQDMQPMDQPIQRTARGGTSAPVASRGVPVTAASRRPGTNNGRGAPMGYANNRRGAAPAPPPPPPGDAYSMDDEENVVLPDDPTERKKVEDRLLSKKKTDEWRRKCQPAAPSVMNISQRKAPSAIKLANLNPDLCDLDKKCKKSSDPKQAMYFVTHLYAGKPGPVVQVEGRLTATPMVSATYDTTNYTIEIHDPLEQRNWSGMSRQFKKNFTKRAVEEKWPYAGQMISKMVFRDFYVHGKIMDTTLREKYADPDLLPSDMVDPDTKQVIECYPPRIKAQLVMSRKTRGLETDVMDENDVQMNPFELRRGNLVRFAIRMGYGYWKAILGSQVPNEYGMPCKLAMIKRLDTQEETEGGPLKRTKWAEDENTTTTSVAGAAGATATVSAPAVATATTAAASAPAPAPPGGPTTNKSSGTEALALAATGDAGAALRAVVAQQVIAGSTTKPAAVATPAMAASSSSSSTASTTVPAAGLAVSAKATSSDKPASDQPPQPVSKPKA